MRNPIDEYLEQLRQKLGADPLLSRRVIEEITDHFAESVAKEMASGVSQREAEENVIRRLGPVEQFASQFERFALPFKLLLLAASIATVGVALWLFWVIAVMLPEHDAAHIPMWRTVAICFLFYSALSGAYLVSGPRHARLRWAMLGTSIAAVGLGLFGVVQMAMRALSGADVEGYIVMMGFLLCGHGLVAIIYTTLTGRIRMEVRAAGVGPA
jgi:hypothetical protein